MKKTKIFLIPILTTILLLCMSVNTQAVETIDTIRYEETKIIAIPGIHNLTFYDSDTGNQDVTIYWTINNSENNLTIICFESNTINIEPGFINNTKAYYYNDTYSDKNYVIYVNYSDVTVPKTLEQTLNETIDEKNLYIDQLEVEVQELINEKAQLNQTINNKNNEIQQWKNQATSFETKYYVEKDKLVPLFQENYNLTNQIEKLENQSKKQDVNNTILGLRVDDLIKTVETMQNPWCGGYTYQGVQYGMPFNYYNMLIGMIIIILIVAGFFIYKHKQEVLKNWSTKSFGDFLSKHKRKELEEIPFNQEIPEELMKMKEFDDTITEKKNNDEEKDKKTKTGEETEKEIDEIIEPTDKPSIADINRVHWELEQILKKEDRPEVQ